MKTQQEIDAENAEANRRAAEITAASNPNMVVHPTQPPNPTPDPTPDPPRIVSDAQRAVQRESDLRARDLDAEGRVLNNPLTKAHGHPNIPAGPPPVLSDVERVAMGQRQMAAQHAANPVNADALKTREAVRQGLSAEAHADAKRADVAFLYPVTPEKEAQLRTFYGTNFGRSVELFNQGLNEEQVRVQIEHETRDLHSGQRDAARQRRAGSVRSGLGETVFYGDGSGAVYPAIVTYVYEADPIEATAADGSNVGTRRPSAHGLANARVDLQVFQRQHIVSVENVSNHSPDGDAVLNGWNAKA